MIGSDKPEATTLVSQEKNTLLLRCISHALLAGGFMLMMLDIRFEHKSVVGEMPIAWLPIFYSMSMLFLIPLGVMLWTRGGKYLLTACYAGAAIVGMVGIYFHSDGHLIERTERSSGRLEILVVHCCSQCAVLSSDFGALLLPRIRLDRTSIHIQ